MRTNGKCKNSHAPSTGLGGILLSARTNIYEGPEHEEISTLYRSLSICIFVLLLSRDSQLSPSIIYVALLIFLYLLVTYLAERRWTISIVLLP